MPRETYEASVAAFSEAMRHELAANAHKGDWDDATTSDQVWEVLYHTAKLVVALKASDKAAVLEYAADVANHALIITELASALDPALLTEDPAEYGAEPVPWAPAMPALKGAMNAIHHSLITAAAEAHATAAQLPPNPNHQETT